MTGGRRRMPAVFVGHGTPMSLLGRLKGSWRLRRHALLHDDALRLADGQAEWTVWLDRAGAKAVDATRGPHLSHAALALDAAADGLGVALTIETLAAADLATGRLVAPFGLRIPLASAYYVVCPEARASQPHVVAFREWLLAESGPSARSRPRQRSSRPRSART